MAYMIDTGLFADNLKYYRERSSYTQKQLADLCLLPVHVIEDCEGGLYTPTDPQLEKLTRRLNLDMTESLILPRPAKREYFEGC